jgi:hypothetical protein
MRPDTREDILAVLTKAKAALEDCNEVILSEVSNETIHNASIYQDKASLEIAVLMYALSKITERKKSASGYIPMLEKAYGALQKKDEKTYETCMKRLVDQIHRDDKKIARYVLQVLDQARLKKSAFGQQR